MGSNTINISTTQIGCIRFSEHILGMQGHIWTETVRTSEQFQTLIYPRMLSVAERAWHEVRINISITNCNSTIIMIHK